MKKAAKILIEGFLAFLLLSFVVIIFVLMNRPSDGRSHTSSSVPKRYRYASWDGDENNIPNADILVQTVEAIGDSQYNYGHIRGFVYNRSGQDYNYVALTFGLETENGVKFGNCFSNMNNLRAGETWEFEAYCSPWRSDGRYYLDEVTTW